MSADSKKQTLLIELLTEELPPKALERLSLSFADDVFAALREQGLAGEDSVCTPFATPRRLALTVSNVATQQPDRMTERKGPAVSASRDADGKISKALEGFMRSAGVVYEQLKLVHDGKADYYAAQIEQKGKSLDDYLPEMVIQALKKLPIPKLMRWGDSEHQFVRPVKSLVLMHGERIVKGEVLGCSSSNVTRGHRFLSSGTITLKNADEYENSLGIVGNVVAGFRARRKMIAAQLERTASEMGAVWIGHGSQSMQELLSLSSIDRCTSSTLLDEVTALVEWPVVYVGEFDQEFLEVPQECLVLTMQQNQKYFPLLDKGGKLLNKFLIVSNMKVKNSAHIIGGNQRVVRSRLSDARFFFNQDRKQKLESRVDKLGSVVYHNKLGSQLQRVERIITLSGMIARLLNADKASAELVARLSKADLLTDMVGEFPELQGVMGYYYALHDGEKPEVAEAIAGHYYPRFAGDSLPQGPLACAVALADKLETLVGIYGIGQVPTGDKDPFGLRRHALGVLRILIETPLELPLPALLKTAAENFPAGMLSAAVSGELEGFMMDRLRGYLRERGYDATHIEAVIPMLNGKLYQATQRLDGVRSFAALETSRDLAAANKRVQNIMRKNIEELGADSAMNKVNKLLLVEKQEVDLYQAIQDIIPYSVHYMERGEYAHNLKSLVALKPFIDDFFNHVMVMTEDKALRKNRAALLNELGRLMNQVADISKLAV
ncbi:MAG TPA: glycine--tRNA ligase subunit beta [Gallionellaceae bacterium]|nr:glycine--tRNA ligase subunit beta [Gallionellaceae bacterium]